MPEESLEMLCKSEKSIQSSDLIQVEITKEYMFQYSIILSIAWCSQHSLCALTCTKWSRWTDGHEHGFQRVMNLRWRFSFPFQSGNSHLKSTFLKIESKVWEESNALEECSIKWLTLVLLPPMKPEAWTKTQSGMLERVERFSSLTPCSKKQWQWGFLSSKKRKSRRTLTRHGSGSALRL